MTARDIRHYKFLRRAVEFKYRFADEPTFETYDYDPSIFRWASNTFYELKLFDYLDIRERAVLVRLYENLKKDPRLKFLDDPDSFKNKDEFKLPESFHVKIASEQAKLSAQAGQATPVGGTAAQSARPVSGRGPSFRPPSLSSTTISAQTSEPAKTETKTETQKTPRANIRFPRSFGAGNVLKNWGSQSSIFLKRNVFGKILTPTRLVTGFTTILGGIAGSGLGPIGTLAGAGAGLLTPSYVKTFGTRHLTRAAHWSADSMVRLSSQTSRLSAGGFGGRSVAGKRFAIAAILLFFGVGALAAFAPLPGRETPPTAVAPISSSPNTNLSSCTFTRAGNSFLVKSSKMAGWISDTALKTGVPAQVLASVAMHENPGFVVNKDDSSEEIKTNTFCNKGPSFCEKSGQVLHSKAYTTGEDDPCTPEEVAGGARTAQAVGLMQILDIYNPGKDLCSITESLTVAAEKLKASGLTQQPTQQQITTAIEQYHNGCSYGSFNYCDEVWKDLQGCQPSSFAGGGLVPTGQGGERIANMGKQIASQLIHSTKAEDAAKRAELATLGIPCEAGGTAGPSYHCWIQSPKYNQIPKDEGYVQCTEFVWATFAEAGYSSQIDKIRRNDAYNWPDEALKNPDIFTVFNDPTQLQPGDIISLGLGSGGIAQHIAVVIDKTENTVQVAQASTAQPTETYNIQSGKLQIINPTNARCTPDTNPGCRISFIRLK